MKSFERLYITDQEDVGRSLVEIDKSPLVAVDCETTGLNPRLSDIRLVQIACSGIEKTYIFDLFKVNLDLLKPYWLNNTGKLGFNLKFDTMMFIHHFGVFIESPVDLFIGELLLKEYMGSLDFKKGAFGLEQTTMRRLGIELSKEMQKSDWSQNELSQQQLDYAARDVEILFPLGDVICKKIDDHGMSESFMVENLCILNTAVMEYTGIKVDKNYLENIGVEIEKKMKFARREIGKFPEFVATQQNMLDLIAGETTIININSWQQKKAALESRWNMYLESTKSAYLKKFWNNDPKLIQLLTEHETLENNMDNHVINILKAINKQTQRVHSDFMQLASPQHRQASKFPIIYNVPRKDSYGPNVVVPGSLLYSENSFRAAYIAEEGRVFTKSDYSQLQLRACAQESQDPVMLKAYLNGEDLHSLTGTFIFGDSLDVIENTPAKRLLAKTTNFALVYMCSPETLQLTFLKQLGVYKSIEECKLFIYKFKRRYRGITLWHKTRPAQVNKMRKIQVRGGRATLLPQGLEASTEAPNFTAALLEQSGAKLAWGKLARIFWYKPYYARTVLNPFDETLVECDIEYAEEVMSIVEKQMIESMQRYIWKVPVVVESKICRRWSGDN